MMNVTTKMDIPVKLSTLWIVVMLNMIYADILSSNIPGMHEEMLEFAGETPISQLMLVAAIVIQIPVLMIFLSRILKYKVNRWVNIIASAMTILFIGGGGSLYSHYLFIASIEISCLLLIIYLAWNWKND